MNNDIIVVTIPKKPDYTSMIRLISSSIGNKVGYNIDEIEDLKVAMGEACILSYGKSSDESIQIEFEIHKDKLEVSLHWDTLGSDEESKEAALGRMIIESLMDEAYYTDDEIRLIKYID
jgi:serine/threonine-protein kinase RsbW